MKLSTPENDHCTV